MFRLLIIFLALPIVLFSQTQKNVTFLDKWYEDTLASNSSKVRYSGCWGFEQENEEYAIIGSTEGTHFFHVNNNKLKQIGFIEGKYNSAQVIHREFKTYGKYAYSVCDEGTSSLQIIDLSYLPDSVVKVADLQNNLFGKTHNLFIDTSNSLLYACLVTPIIGGIPTSIIPLRVFSLADPLNPTLLWEGPDDIPVVHDIYVRDNIAFLNCGEYGLRVYDFTNPVAPIYKSNLTFYQDQGYNHQGWLSPNGKTYIFADETSGKRVKKCSVSSNYSIQVNQLFGVNSENGSISHNIMCTDEFAFIAYYNEGLRIFDIRSNPKEIAHYDTYPDNSPFKMNGAWGVYSNYSSGNVIISDRQYGLFLFNFDKETFLAETAEEFSIYPNPSETGTSFTIRSENDETSDFSIELYDGFGRKVDSAKSGFNSYSVIESPSAAGIYFARIQYTNYLGEELIVTKKISVQ
jgi:choice-of-anchor B domain-containing protein